MSTATLITAEQFTQMRAADTEAYELVEGELTPLASGTALHNLIRDRLVVVLWNYFKGDTIGRYFAETDCQFSSHTIRRPGLSIFLGERAAQIDLRKTPVPFAPDIAVEILSPSERAIDVNRKAIEYLAAGCREIWLVDHDNSEVFVQTDASIRLLRGTNRLESPLLPGFSQAVAELLAL